MFEDGTLSKLFRDGFVSVTIFTYREIYLYVDLLMKVRGFGKEKAVQESELKFNCSRKKIYIALSHFK